MHIFACEFITDGERKKSNELIKIRIYEQIGEIRRFCIDKIITETINNNNNNNAKKFKKFQIESRQFAYQASVSIDIN